MSNQKCKQELNNDEEINDQYHSVASKEKEVKIKGHQKRLSKVELHVENINVKYDGIISTGSTKKNTECQRLQSIIVLKKNTDD